MKRIPRISHYACVISPQSEDKLSQENGEGWAWLKEPLLEGLKKLDPASIFYLVIFGILAWVLVSVVKAAAPEVRQFLAADRKDKRHHDRQTEAFRVKMESRETRLKRRNSSSKGQNRHPKGAGDGTGSGGQKR